MISGLFFLFEGLEDVGMVLRTVRYENGTKTVRKRYGTQTSTKLFLLMGILGLVWGKVLDFGELD